LTPKVGWSPVGVGVGGVGVAVVAVVAFAVDGEDVVGDS
jgi:hypothetical protein